MALREAYRRIRDACETVRDGEGFDAVLQYNPLAPTGRTQEQVAAEVVPRTVLVLDTAKADVTDAVLNLLDS